MIDHKEKMTIGSVEIIKLPELSDTQVHARVDSGARTSAIWGKAVTTDDNKLKVSFFENGKVSHIFDRYGKQVVASSNGQTETRYTVKLLVIIAGRKIRATFTIANRQSQVYPVLVGRNVLRGKFIVDVTMGRPLKKAEREKIKRLQSLLKEEL